MHVRGLSFDFSWLIQLIITSFLVISGFIYFVKNTASRYLELGASLDTVINSPQKSNRSTKMPGISRIEGTCIVCGTSARSRCSGCKSVLYCSHDCQASHWGSGHKRKCMEFRSSSGGESGHSVRGRRMIGNGGIALIPGTGNSKIYQKPPKQALFPYNDFLEFFSSDKLDFPPCGLLNCGNSCFANAILQCLTFTRPLAAYLIEKAHGHDCERAEWCFTCEFEEHVKRVVFAGRPFSPVNIISRIPNIGGCLGSGKQEDAHEFMRLVIDTMQSVCLEQFGGEKYVHPASQETTLIQHIFGGHLQSQIVCSKCDRVSDQIENMMDLTVEIQEDASSSSLEECLGRFTAREWLHGDNMYKCEGCDDYVGASKRLTIRRPPNVLTVALKRFQKGRFGKLNRRVSFSASLDLAPYVVGGSDDGNVYGLYAVVVHLDMLNSSFFGHYICFVKDFRGDWHRVDDDKVERVELEEVLTQTAYMLLYTRSSPRSFSLRHDGFEPAGPPPQVPEASGVLAPEITVDVSANPVTNKLGPLLSPGFLTKKSDGGDDSCRSGTGNALGLVGDPIC